MSDRVTIKNRKDLLKSGPGKAKEIALDLFEEGINSVLPERAIPQHLEFKDGYLVAGQRKYDMGEIGNVFVLGAGKAALGMAKGVESALDGLITQGLIVVKSEKEENSLKTIRVASGGHPIPDKYGMKATGELLEIARSAESKDLVICLISGGGSALLTLPSKGIELKDIQSLTKHLLQSGASIDEINTIRKHLSDVKGGKLAKAIHPGKTLSLIVSDVVGDDMSYVGSGPTVSEDSTPGDALRILEDYDLKDKVPDSILNVLSTRGEADSLGPVKSEEFGEFRVENQVIVSNMTALSAISDKARKLGVSPLILSSRLEGETRYHGQVLGQLASSLYYESQPQPRPSLLLSGGETTVTLPEKHGRGGPNQEFALAGALEIQGVPSAVLGAIDSDGDDGSTSVAGGLLDGSSISDQGQVEYWLQEHHSSTAIEELGGAIITGPTGTNVNDLRLALVL